MTEEVSVVIVNYNGLGTVLDTVRSALRLRNVRPRVLVVDDGSTDGSPEAVQRAFPGVAVHREPRNTREVNRLRNIGLDAARTDRVLIADNDVIFDADCVSEMLRVMDSDTSIAACLPRMMYAGDRSLVYMAGGQMHFVGATIAPHRHEPYVGGHAPRPAVGGGIMLLDRGKGTAVGGFDEGYGLAWGDDIEFHQRLLLAGYRCMYVPTAFCLHDYKPFDASRHYRARGQIRHRWRYILTHYEGRTLLLIAPALILYEGVQAAFLASKGLGGLYCSGTLDALKALRTTLRRRREVQALRRIPDREVLFAGSLYVRPEHAAAGRRVARVVGGLSAAFALYWRLIGPLLARSPHAGEKRRVERRSEA